MSKADLDVPERLRAAGATDLERRLLEAASREQPSPELSERMARAIGVSVPGVGSDAMGSVKTDTAAANGASASSSLVPWISGALVAVGVAVGAYVVTRPSVKPAASSAVASPGSSASALSIADAAPLLAPSPPTQNVSPPALIPANTAEEPRAKAPGGPSPRGRKAASAHELANQIALVDAARSALGGGGAERALGLALEYQKAYPSGTFRPEVSAVKIEALVKLGRTTEARTLAERFVVAYGPGPLADRVARLAHLAQP
jgi:hypothetical protein